MVHHTHLLMDGERPWRDRPVSVIADGTLLDAVGDLCGDLAVVLSLEGRHIWSSASTKAYVRSFHRPSDALSSCDVSALIDEVVHPDDVAKIGDAFAHPPGAPERRVVGLRLRHPDGDWRDYEVTVGSVGTASHLCLVFVGRDLSRPLIPAFTTDPMKNLHLH